MRTLIPVLTILLACGDGSSPTPDMTLADSGRPALGLRTLGPWEPCPLVPGEDTAGAECAIATLPLDHADPASPDFEVLVKRRPARGEELQQLWILHGGPSDSAIDDLEPLGRPVSGIEGLALYAVDHRGIGGSARLGCSAESPTSEGGGEITDGEWGACVAEARSAPLPYLTATQSAADLAALIDGLAAPETEVFLYGASYGTHLALRYLRLRPDQPSGVVLEGITTPVDPPFEGYDQAMNRAARELFARCAVDDSCASHFSPESPWDAITRVVRSLDEGHCPALGLDSDGLRATLGTLVGFDQLRVLVPAIATRVDRCEPSDVEALERFAAVIGGALDPTFGNLGNGRSELIFWHVALSELYEGGDPEALHEEFRELTIATGLELRLAQRHASWPRYAPDEHHQQWPSYDGPLLMLQGGLDPATPAERARALRDRFDAPGQTYAEFPLEAHDLLGRTPTDDGDCATRLLHTFLADPVAVDTACVDEVRPPAFDGEPAINEYLFGTEHAWAD